jgi:NitT/TauT family transport system substrate-binding protein
LSRVRDLKILKKLVLAFFILSGFLIMIPDSLSCSKTCSAPIESVRFGTSLLEPCIPLFVAEDRRCFDGAGLTVNMTYYDSGLSQVNGMLKGEVDMCGSVAEYVLVGNAFKKQKIVTIASIDKVENFFIVARKDRGIAGCPDLRGKRIGAVRGTIAEFYLGRCLELQGINIKEVTLVNMATFSRSTEAVVAGDVDACISIVPYVEEAQAKLGYNGILLAAQSGQFLNSLLLCPNELAASRPETMVRFLSAINQAEDYIIQHPEEAKAIVRRKLNVADDEVARAWSRNRFSLSLDQSLIAAMEDEARWMISNGLTAEKQVPDFLNYIYDDSLKAVKPEAVRIIR